MRSRRIARCVTAVMLWLVPACGDDGGGEIDEGIPDVAYCDPVASWDSTWADFEVQVLTLVNQRRSEGADCGSEGTFAPTHALEMDGALRCAARAHSLDMQQQGYFSHTSLNGDAPWDRFERAGYEWSYAGENIARGQQTPETVMQSWMGSDDHCSNIMSSNFVHIGIGFVGDGYHWTQGFAAPR